MNIKKILLYTTLAVFTCCLILTLIILMSSTFSAQLFIHTLFTFGFSLHLLTMYVVIRQTQDRKQIQKNVLFFVTISFLFLVYSLYFANDPREISNITIFLNLITVGIAGSFLMNNNDVVRVFSYKSIIHAVYWFCFSCLASTFLFSINHAIWIKIINWDILLIVLILLTGILTIPTPIRKED